MVSTLAVRYEARVAEGEGVERARLPTMTAYLERIPGGLDAHPQCQIKGSILHSLIDDTGRPHGFTEGHCGDLPAPVAALVLERPPVSTWIPEAHFHALAAAMRDVCFDPGPEGLEQFEAVIRAGNRAALSTRLYRLLFSMVTAPRLLNNVGRRWSQFHRGSELRVIDHVDQHGRVRMTFPDHLLDEVGARAFRGAFSAALELAGTSSFGVDIIQIGATHVDYAFWYA